MTTAPAAAAVRGFRPGDEPAIRAVMEASLALDAIPGFDRHDVDQALVRIPAEPSGTAVAIDGGAVVGYVTPRHDDLTVHPAWRRRGHGRRLVEAGAAIVRAAGRSELILYVPEAAQPFARALGFRYRSSLWLLRLPTEEGVPEPAFPVGVGIRSFRPLDDLAALVELMNASFVDHPSPISWSEEVVRRVNAQPDFDPSGVLLVHPAGDLEHLVGFVRTELVAAEDGRRGGEVKLLGVLPGWRGLGIGRALLYWGIRDLRSRGAAAVYLAVEAGNDRALALYRRTGFRPDTEWPHWALRV